jgi:hypothetical protein
MRAEFMKFAEFVRLTRLPLAEPFEFMLFVLLELTFAKQSAQSPEDAFAFTGLASRLELVEFDSNSYSFMLPMLCLLAR